jgi:formylmethanofuran dehydrogenase subunit C
MPAFASRVLHYQNPRPLFSNYHLDTQVDATNHPEVTLPSGGSIVISVTEAIVAVDVNSGRSTGQSDVEETAFKTNREAAEAIATQLRLRDLGGLIVIEGDASSRCGISMKGVDIVVGGSVGHMSAFMAQSGNLVVCGDAGEALGDSIYEARLYVKGRADNLGADCIEKEMRAEHLEDLAKLLERAKMKHRPQDFRRYGSARKLYNFNVDHADAY